MEEFKDAEVEPVKEEKVEAPLDPVAQCSQEINAILEKYGMAIAVSQPQPVLVPKKELPVGK
jgi:hypothetical protein